MFLRGFSTFLRFAVVLLLLCAVIEWIVKYEEIIVRPGSGESLSAADAEIQRELDRLEADDPNARDEIVRLRENHKHTALAACLRDDRDAGAEPFKLGLAHKLCLADLSLNRKLFFDAGDREEFLVTHATALTLLGEKEAPDYLSRLSQARNNAVTWRIAKHDPVGMLICDSVTDSNRREYYERERDWLGEFLFDVATSIGDADSGQVNVASNESISAAIDIAMKYHPHVKSAAVSRGPEVLPIFAQFGGAIGIAIEKGLPLMELLEVLFANADYFDEWYANKPVSDLVAHLLLIRNEKPEVWEAARVLALALRLDHDVPALANSLLKRYATDDLATFLYAAFEEEIVYAAACVEKFGDLAMYELNRYADSREFRTALRKPGVGPRLIPYVAKFGDKGLERIEDENAWLDKYFERDGTPKEEEWWTALPGGSAVNVARNWATGIPNEWSELGWGALDVGDAVLLVASFGTSEAATGAAKAAAKSAARRALRASAKSVPKGARESAKRGMKSLLGKTVRGAFRLIKVAGAKGWKIVRLVSEGVSTAATKVVSAARTLRDDWRTVPAWWRRATYRGLLAAGLFLKVTQHTIPAMDKLATAAGTLAAELMKGLRDLPAKVLSAAINDLLGPTQTKGTWVPVLVFWLTFAGLGLLLVHLAWRWFWPWRRRKLVAI